MNTHKTLQELTIKNNFLFSAVMLKDDNCKRLLELILQTPIEMVEVNREQTIVYNPEYRGIRLDVYAKDENRTRYNVEMQVASENLFKRVRYYHSQMDMDILTTGTNYSELPETYVIFICDFDPVGSGHFIYTCYQSYEEEPGERLENGSHTYLLNTRGTKEDEIPRQLLKFLKFVHGGPEESEMDFEDEFVCKLQNDIKDIKQSREFGEKYMLLKDMLYEERREGREEGREEGMAELCGSLREEILHVLEETGTVSESVQLKLENIHDFSLLKRLVVTAARVESAEQFEKQLSVIVNQSETK